MTSPAAPETHERTIRLPPQIRDLGTLAAWLRYANFLERTDLERIEKDYAGVL